MRESSKNPFFSNYIFFVCVLIVTFFILLWCVCLSDHFVSVCFIGGDEIIILWYLYFFFIKQTIIPILIEAPPLDRNSHLTSCCTPVSLACLECQSWLRLDVKMMKCCAVIPTMHSSQWGLSNSPAGPRVLTQSFDSWRWVWVYAQSGILVLDQRHL